jgi:hypothetical protein
MEPVVGPANISLFYSVLSPSRTDTPLYLHPFPNDVGLLLPGPQSLAPPPPVFPVASPAELPKLASPIKISQSTIPMIGVVAPTAVVKTVISTSGATIPGIYMYIYVCIYIYMHL